MSNEPFVELNSEYEYVSCKTETHCDVDWETFYHDNVPFAFIHGDRLIIEHNEQSNTWSLLKDNNIVFQSSLLKFVFMVAREIAFDTHSDDIVPIWEG